MNQIRILKTIWIISHIVAILSMVLLPLSTVLAGIIVGLFLHIIGQGIALHRYFSHKSFKTYKMVDIFLTLITIPCALGSPISWSALHRHHHKVSDTLYDDQSPSHNTWHSIWLCSYLGSTNGFNMVRDLLRDKFQVWVHSNYTNLVLAWIVLVGLFGMTPLVVLVFIPIVVTYTLTMAGSIIVHKWGYRNHNTDDQSKNSILVSIITLGDGWHNNHHAFPNRINTGEKWFEFDLLYWIIRTIKTN